VYGHIRSELQSEIEEIRRSGQFKSEREILSAQQPRISVRGREVLNFCANNYLGLANNPEVILTAHEALNRWGFGMASERFISGTQSIHLVLEASLSEFLGTEETLLYNSCFDANGGLFESLLGRGDAVIADEFSHASIIDGIRLCRAKCLHYRHSDLVDLEAQLSAAQGCRRRLIATDGVFSMDGSTAKLTEICDLADRFRALVMVDDSHAVGVLGPQGRGSPEYHGVVDRVDILTGTLGKALGGASGGYTSGRREIIELLRQRSRPYLFSNSLPPMITEVTLRVLTILRQSEGPRRALIENARHFRCRLREEGFDIRPGDHPIVAVMIGSAAAAMKLAERLLEKGIYVLSMVGPAVPEAKAGIRLQLSAAHTIDDLERAVRGLTECKAELGV
jgi:glycine C-acetyltransferase